MPVAPSALRADIQLLRALAVVSVVVFHFHLRGSGGGFMGVDVFFVISGYLMTRIIVDRLEQERFSYLEFVIARAVRIVPALLVMIAVLLALGAWWLPPNDLKTLSTQAWAALFFTSNLFYLGNGGYFEAVTVGERWLLHTWSLSVEWQFYLLHPLVLAGLWTVLGPVFKLRNASRRHVLTGLCVLAFCMLFARCLLVTDVDRSRAFYSLSTRAWEMLGGGTVFLLESRRVHAGVRRHANALFAALVLALLGYMGVAAKLDLDHAWPGPWPLPAVLITMGLITVGRHVDARWVAHPLPQALGRWSYSIYLWHWPVAVTLSMLYPDSMASPALITGAIVVSTLLGALSYRLVEQPALRHAARRGGVAVALSLLGCGVALQGANHLIERSDGWMSRAGGDRAFFERVATAQSHSLVPAPCQNWLRRPQELGVCTVGATKPGRRTLVYGDSHAQHLYAWFEAHADRPVDFLTSAGCVPAPGYNRRESGYHCDGFVARVQALAADPRYDTIVVAGNWAGGMNSVHPALCLAGAAPGCLDGTPPTRAALVEANTRFWRRLIGDGKQVYVTDQMPMAGFNVATTLSRERFWHQPLTRRYRPAHRDPRPYIDDVRAAMADVPGFHLLEIGRALCSADGCNTLDVTGDMPTLIDGNHFAPAWIRSHGQSVLAALP